MKLIYNVGINNRIYPTKKNNKMAMEYRHWIYMISRCYNESIRFKNPTYKDCSVSDNFKHYSYFYEWCNQQIGFGCEGWQLDKDILIKGNKIYSENTCCFVPSQINSLFTKCDSIRGNFPIGITFQKNRYIASCRTSNKNKYIGTYLSIDEAFIAYKNAKENYIKEITSKYITELDSKIVEVLMNYSVDITD